MKRTRVIEARLMRRREQLEYRRRRATRHYHAGQQRTAARARRRQPDNQPSSPLAMAVALLQMPGLLAKFRLGRRHQARS